MTQLRLRVAGLRDLSRPQTIPEITIFAFY